MISYSEYQVECPRIKPEHYAEYYVPVFKNGHRLQKSKHKIGLCQKCGLRYPEENFASLCYICGLKDKGFYQSAIRNLTDPHTGEIGGGWGFHTNWDFKVGWSFAMCLLWVMLATNILNHPGLNKTCKLPGFTKGLRPDGWPMQLSFEDTLAKLSETVWRIKTAKSFYNLGN